jgi:hypothetical protein
MNTPDLSCLARQVVSTVAGARGTLILDWSNGQRSEWALEFNVQRDELYVNGNRWLRGANERCR